MNAPGGAITEEIWNTTASLDHQPYSLSQTLAEGVAWEIADAQDRWKLVVINPSLVIGPSLQKSPTSESFNIAQMHAGGAMKMGVPKIGIGLVDVRDLAQAHLAAGILPEAHGRNIISAHNSDFLAMAEVLLDDFGDDYALPKRVMPKWLVWLVGPSQEISRKFVKRNVNVPWRADSSKAVRELGVSFRPLEESVVDMMEKMIADGAFKA